MYCSNNQGKQRRKQPKFIVALKSCLRLFTCIKTCTNHKFFFFLQQTKVKVTNTIQKPELDRSALVSEVDEGSQEH